MNANQDADVTVVGAGPVGLVLAAELALSGAAVRVIERRAEPDEAIKAGTINVPTAEALDRRGLLPAAEKVQRQTIERVGSFARIVDDQPSDGGRRGRESRFTGHFAGMTLDAALVDESDPDLAAHAAVAGARMVPQRELEELLAGHVARLGVPPTPSSPDTWGSPTSSTLRCSRTDGPGRPGGLTATGLSAAG